MKKSKKYFNQKKKGLQRKKKQKEVPTFLSEQIDDENGLIIPFPRRIDYNDWNELEFK